MNWKEKSWWGWGTYRDSGQLKSISYTKQRADTTLRVSFYTTMAQSTTGNGTGGCAQWYLLFNDKQCTNPSPIFTSIVRHRSDLNEQNVQVWYVVPAVITGYCKGTSKDPFPQGSTIKVSAHLRSCSLTTGDAHTGEPHVGNVTTSLVVEEYCTPKN